MELDPTTPKYEGGEGNRVVGGLASPVAAAGRVRFLVLGLFIALAAVALAGVYSLARLDSYSGLGPEPSPGVSVLRGAYPAELGADGLSWAWIGDSATLRVRGDGPSWLGMRAQSLRRPRRVIFRSPDGVARKVYVPATRPAVIVAGPFQIDGEERLTMTPSPLAELASYRDRRQVSVFMSGVRLSRTPLVAVPGAGFYASEVDADGTTFNWLGRHGQLDVRSADVRLTRFWLRFRVRSVDLDREVTISSGRIRREIQVGGGVRPGQVEVGPFPLRSGRAALTIASTTPPRRYGRDARALSVRLDGVRARPAPSRPVRP